MSTENFVSNGNAIELFTKVRQELDKKQDILTFDIMPTEFSVNPVTSGGVYQREKLLDDYKLDKTDEMPEPSEDLEGTPVIYVGATTSTYTKGHIYECQEITPSTTPKTYEWVDIGASGGITVDSAMSTTSTNPVQNKVVDNAIRTGDSKDNTTTFTSSDVTDGSATSWKSVTKLNSGEKHSSIFAKVSQMFKNVRYLYKLLGTTDVSSFFGGSNQSVTDALATLNTNIGSHTVNKNVPSDAVFTDSWRPVVNNLTSTSTTSSLSAYQGKVLNGKVTDLNSALSNIPIIDSGKKNGIWNQSQSQITVTFNKQFSSAPTFIYSIMNKTSNTSFTTWISQISKTSATIIIYGSISVNQSIEVNWVAIEN